jgi:hypothetical protein
MLIHPRRGGQLKQTRPLAGSECNKVQAPTYEHEREHERECRAHKIIGSS